MRQFSEMDNELVVKLYDVICPPDFASKKGCDNLFVVMESAETDLNKLL